MALTQSSLATRIKDELENQKGAPADPDRLDEFAQAIAKAVVDEIQANAVVNTTVVVTGVQTGGSNANGTGVGTIS